jgi:hypothetical protein
MLSPATDAFYSPNLLNRSLRIFLLRRVLFPALWCGSRVFQSKTPYLDGQVEDIAGFNIGETDVQPRILRRVSVVGNLGYWKIANDDGQGARGEDEMSEKPEKSHVDYR